MKDEEKHSELEERDDSLGFLEKDIPQWDAANEVV